MEERNIQKILGAESGREHTEQVQRVGVTRLRAKNFAVERLGLRELAGLVMPQRALECVGKFARRGHFRNDISTTDEHG